MIRKFALRDVALAGLLAAGSFVAAMPFGSNAMAGAGPKGHSHATFSAGVAGDPKKPSRVIEIAMRDGPGTMVYVPAEIEVKQGEQIKFVIKNEGDLDHEFVLDSFEGNAKHKIEMEKNPEMEHDDPNAKRTASKKSSEILWRFTKAGRFEFACLIPGHYEAGMKGVVVVASAAQTAQKNGSASKNGAPVVKN
jgi:uncharacterized cupredoxin-like copper-binding protein